jgi:hypothetical protein
MLINPAKQPAVPQNGFGFKALFVKSLGQRIMFVRRLRLKNVVYIAH